MRHTATIIATAAICALVGCSSSAKQTAAGTSAGQGSTPVAVPSSPAGSTSVAAPGSVPAAVGSGACKYVNVAQASALAGSKVRVGVSRTVASGPVTFQYCDYPFDPGNAPGVSVAVAELKGNGSALFAALRSSKQSEDNYQVVPGVGDEAFFANENLSVRKGETGLILFVGRANGYPRGPAGLADEKKLAALILAQI